MNNNSDSKRAVLEIDDIERSYAQGGEKLEVFRGASMKVHAGEMVALVGPSGSGKSSLLHIAGLLEKPNKGNIAICGTATKSLHDKELSRLRRSSIGFVFQFHHLLSEFSALENVTMPQRIKGTPKARASKQAQKLLRELGLGGRLQHRPGQLSGGEQQRVAIARALANDPDILLADEPTGDLDPETARMVFKQLLESVRSRGLAALIATHNLDLAAHMDRVVLLRGGLLHEGADLAREFARQQ